MFNEFDSLFTLFDVMENELGTKKVDPKRFEKRICTNSYPPSNVYVNSNGDYVIEVALCGLEPGKDYNVTMSKNVLTLKIENKKVKSTRHYLQHGLKIPSESEVKWLIDDNNVNLDDFTTTFENGLFRITFMKKTPEKVSEFKII